jgi:hypothetical protein
VVERVLDSILPAIITLIAAVSQRLYPLSSHTRSGPPENLCGYVPPVTLSSVITCFDRGATPEEIVDSFNTLHLADVYSVIGYYLRHEAEVQAYLEKERKEGGALRKEIEAKLPTNPLRKRLAKIKRVRPQGTE